MAAIHHDGSPRYVEQGSSHARVRLRTPLDAPVAGVFARTCPDGEQTFTPLRRSSADALCQWWEVELPLAVPRTGYRFLIKTDTGNWWLTAAGLMRHTPTDATDFKIVPAAQEPGWVRDAVFYQIFPDRFADGDPSNNVADGEYLCYGKPVVARRWGELPLQSQGGREFFGGDLQGIAQRLDYLQDLGVTALYLTPIFTSPSSHKYDVADYEQVDPHFGGEAALAELRRALDARGMRLMLDVVPNHCGSMHRWFREAQADPNSPWTEFFIFRKHPDQYEGWLGVPTLPKLNYRSQLLRETMYAGPDAIMRRWLRPPYRIDAWRIDVANMLARHGESQLGHKVGRGIRRAVKSEAVEVYLLGENFFDGTPHLQGDELDATMNYRGFTLPLLHWLSGRDSYGSSPWGDPQPLPTEALAAQWRAFMAGIPWQIVMQQFNLLGSHDTPRVLTVLGDVARVRLAMTLLFTYPGVPCVYYGDEIGLPGGPDPDCRRTMPWDEAAWNHELRAHVQRLAQLRRSAPALRWGGFQLLYAQDEALAFLRDAPEQRLIVVARRAGDSLSELPVRQGGIADGTRFRELWGTQATVTGGMLRLDGLAPVGAQVWVEEGRG
ncbi:MAG: maltodextrin glucosidase [Roseiflexaceae bacterium]